MDHRQDLTLPFDASPANGSYRVSTVELFVYVADDDSGTVDRVRELARQVRAAVPFAVAVTTVRPGAGRYRSGAAPLDSAADAIALIDVDMPDPSGVVLALLDPVARAEADVTVAVADADGAGSHFHARLLRFAFGLHGVPDRAVAGRTAALRPLLRRVTGDAPGAAAAMAMLARHFGLRVRDVPAGTTGRFPHRAVRHLESLVRATYAVVTDRGRLGERAPATLAPPLAAAGMKFVLFGIVGALSGVLYVLVYLPARELAPPAVANFLALVLAALFNIEVNRAWTFRRSRVARFGMHIRSAMLFAAHYGLTTGAVVALLAVNADASRTAEIVTLLTADLLMSIARFLGLDRWVFGRGRSMV